MGHSIKTINKDKLYDLCNKVFECLFFIILFVSSLKVTTFNFSNIKLIQYLLCLALTPVVGVKMLLIWPWHRRVWIGAALALLYLLVFWSGRYGIMLLLGAATLGCMDIDLDRLMKIYLLSVGTVTIITILSSLGGAIPNLIFLKDNYVRSSFGICYPTDFATLVLFLLMFLYISWKKLPEYFALLFPVFSLYVSSYVAHSQTSTYCSILFLLAVCFNILDGKVRTGRGFLKKMSVFVHFLYTIVFPVSALGMVALTIAYQKQLGFAYRMNEFMSSRLRLAADALAQHGLHPFGAPFEMVGGGYSVFSAYGYNFVDSTYMLILIRYGWVLLVFLGTLWCWKTSEAIRCGNYRLAAVMAIIAVHSISEHHFMEICYNVLLVMPFAHICGEKSENRREAELQTEDCKRRILLAKRQSIPVIAALLPLILMGCAFLAALDWMRTCVQALHLTGGGDHAAVIFAFSFLMLLSLSALMWSFYQAALWNEEPLGESSPDDSADNPLSENFSIKTQDSERPGFKSKKLVISAAALSLLIYGITIVGANHVIHQAALDQKDLIAADSKAIHDILDAKEGSLYVTEFPEVYHRSFPGIRRSIFSGEELAHYQNTTVVVPKDFDSKVFINAGFLYAPVSEQHAIYTNDHGVIAELQRKGYHFTGYCPAVYEVDLAEQAELNDLPLTADGAIQLDGPQHSMLHGPYVNLYDGVYAVTCKLSLDDPDETSEADQEVALLRVNAYKGQIQSAEVPITRGQFDEDGNCTAALGFWSGSYQDIEFLVLADAGQKVKIHSISYTRAVDTDTHIFLNKHHQKAREEYYDLDGNKTLASDGSAAHEYEYDSHDNINVIRYYDLDNHLALNTSGYAEIHRTFNERHQVIREEYFGMDHEPILNAAGIAAVDYQYDEDGNITVEKYYDIAGNLVNNINGVAEVQREFDSDRQMVSETHYDAAGKITA